MKAIITKYHGPTDYKGACITASDEDNNRITIGLECSICGSTFGRCAECGARFDHGTHSHCPKETCHKVNAPIDCLCGFVVASSKDGVLDLNMNLHRFIMEAL